MKKFTALFLSFIMLLTVCCIPVFAENEEDETEISVKEEINRIVMERFDARVRAMLVSNNKNNKTEVSEEKENDAEYVNAEEAVDRFEAELGYRPEYTVQQWYPTHWSLTVTFTHSPNGVTWDCEINNPDDDGWRMERNRFEELFEEMKPMYLTVPEDYVGNEKWYTTEDVENLFFEEYGYDINVYACDYWDMDGVSVNFIVCDQYNGNEIEIDAVKCDDGNWYVLESGWLWFVENYELKEEKRYATKDVNYLSIEDIEAEFELMLDYVPEISIYEENEFLRSIEICFDHLGGKMYHIDYSFEKDGDVFVTDKVFENFLEKYPATTFVPKFTSLKQIIKMLEFYIDRLLAE